MTCNGWNGGWHGGGSLRTHRGGETCNGWNGGWYAALEDDALPDPAFSAGSSVLSSAAIGKLKPRAFSSAAGGTGLGDPSHAAVPPGVATVSGAMRSLRTESSDGAESSNGASSHAEALDFGALLPLSLCDFIAPEPNYATGNGSR